MNPRGLGEEKGFAVGIKGLTDVLMASENGLLGRGMKGFCLLDRGPKFQGAERARVLVNGVWCLMGELGNHKLTWGSDNHGNHR